MPDGAPTRVSDAEKDEARAKIALSVLIGRDIPLVKVGREMGARCPFHQEKSPSFFVNDTKRLFHCFGCGQNGDHYGWLIKYHKLSFRDAHARLMAIDGAAPSAAQRFVDHQRALTREYDAWPGMGGSAGEDERTEMHKARAVYEAAKPVAGTVAHQYLRARKLGRIPEDWRCHPGLACIEAGDHKEFPALIVPLRDRANRIISIQRIWLDPKTLQRPLNPETGKKIKKKTWGPPFDASARVGVISGETLGLAEGPEKALAVKQLFSLPCWASCGAGRLQVAAQWIPPGIKKLIIFADFDSLDERKTLTRTDADGVVTEWPNPNFGTRTGMRAAFSAAELYEHKGYVVTIEPPKGGAHDWSEVLENGLA